MLRSGMIYWYIVPFLITLISTVYIANDCMEDDPYEIILKEK